MYLNPHGGWDDGQLMTYRLTIGDALEKPLVGLCLQWSKIDCVPTYQLDGPVWGIPYKSVHFAKIMNFGCFFLSAKKKHKFFQMILAFRIEVFGKTNRLIESIIPRA